MNNLILVNDRILVAFDISSFLERKRMKCKPFQNICINIAFSLYLDSEESAILLWLIGVDFYRVGTFELIQGSHLLSSWSSPLYSE